MQIGNCGILICYEWLIDQLSQLALTCSKLAIETLEQSVEYVQS